MPTISKHAGKTTRGKYPALCAYCGAHWPRDMLKKDESGKLYCPDEGKGLDSAALDRIIAADGAEAARRRYQSQVYDGATIATQATDPTVADHPVPGTTGAALLNGFSCSAETAHLYRNTDIDHG